MTETITDTTERVEDPGSDPEVSVGSPPTFHLRISSDKVRILLDCPDPHRDLDSTVGRIVAELKSLELPAYPDEEFVSKVLGNICQPGDHVIDATLVLGQTPVPPRHGRLDWSRDYFAGGWQAADAAAVDFWAKLDNRSVQADEKLLEVHPAVPGEPGLNIFGNKIPVEKPNKARVRCGKGVREVEAADQVKVFYAEFAGRVRFTDNTLAVDEIYIIKGNVDLETGNISHTGTLQIEGDVETGASIEADGDINIKGMLEPANVRAGGSLTVNGGIVGSEDTLIVVGDEVQAKYIREAVIRAEGHITVSNEIAHSDIETRGKVEASRGRIAGGRTIARMGISVGEAGASGSSQTLLAAGVDPTLAAKVSDMKAKLCQMEKARVKLRQAIEVTREKPDGPSESDLILIEGLERKINNLGQTIADGELALQNMITDAMSGASDTIYMLRECWAGTTVQLGDAKTFVRISILKPRLAKRFKNRVRVVPLGENNMPDPAAN